MFGLDSVDDDAAVLSALTTILLPEGGSRGTTGALGARIAPCRILWNKFLDALNKIFNLKNFETNL